MKLAVLRERSPNENRVALTPEVVKRLTKEGFTVCVEAEAGLNSGFSDEVYLASGASISKIPLEIIADADVILKVSPSPIDLQVGEHNLAKAGSTVIGMLDPYNNKELIGLYQKKQVNAIALELMPRITKVQHMDVLSSQSNLAGYRAVIEAAHLYRKSFPMFMTTAGTVIAAKVLVIGVGVAGLQAIATAKRLGAVVTAYDIRPDAMEQAASLGASKLDIFDNSEVTLLENHKDILAAAVTRSDIVITTAQVLGKKAPRLIYSHDIANMKAGSVIIDMAASSGGNVEGVVVDSVTQSGGVLLAGYSNLPSKISHDASKLYANNLYNSIKYLFDGDRLKLEDDVVSAMLVTKTS